MTLKLNPRILFGKLGLVQQLLHLTWLSIKIMLIASIQTCFGVVTLYTLPNPPSPSLLATEKLSVALLIVLRSKIEISVCSLSSMDSHDAKLLFNVFE